MSNEKVCLHFEVFQNKVAHKNNLRTQSLLQNKKAVLTTVAYYKFSTPVRSQRQKTLKI